MDAKLLVFTALLLGAAVGSAQLTEGNECQIAGGSPGVCKRSSTCPAVQNLIKMKMRIILCSYYRIDSVVCCPNIDPTTIGLPNTAPRPANRPRRPNRLRPVPQPRPVTTEPTTTRPSPANMDRHGQAIVNMRENEECHLSDGSPGVCTRTLTCPEAPQESATRCSSDRHRPLVCCRRPAEVTATQIPKTTTAPKTTEGTNAPLINTGSRINTVSGSGLGDECQAAEGSPGVCKRSSACPVVQNMLKMRMRIELCTYYREDSIICCPNVDPTTLGSLNIAQRFPIEPRPVTTESTTTPRAESITSVTAMDKNLTVSNMRKRCMQYAQYVYVERFLPSLMISAQTFRDNTCAMVGQPLITGGDRAVLREFPHMVALGFGNENAIDWLCGGTLISERFVLTAAHCLSAHGSPVRWVRLGDLNIRDSRDDGDHTVTIAVGQIIKHEGYKRPAQYNDIALLKLASDVTLGPFIRPACLYTEEGDPPQPVATATGWGKDDDYTNEGTAELMKVDLTLRDSSNCTRKFRNFIRNNSKLPDGIASESMVCAGDVGGVRDTCQGDSGGPLQIRLTNPYYCMYSIVGLTSFSLSGCGKGDTAAIYTRVSNYLPWIEEHVWPTNHTQDNAMLDIDTNFM